jgi:hypothetical protein
VIGDHGEFGAARRKTHGIFLYEPRHMPFIIAGPGIPSGQVIKHQVRSIDVMPTVLSFWVYLQKEVQERICCPSYPTGARTKAKQRVFETIYPRTYMAGLNCERCERIPEIILAPRPEFMICKDFGEIKSHGSNTAVSEELERFLWDVAGQSRNEN